VSLTYNAVRNSQGIGVFKAEPSWPEPLALAAKDIVMTYVSPDVEAGVQHPSKSVNRSTSNKIREKIAAREQNTAPATDSRG
jgi:hypothetical protein